MTGPSQPLYQTLRNPNPMNGPPQPVSQTHRNPNPMTGPPQPLSQIRPQPSPDYPLSQTPLHSPSLPPPPPPPPSLPLSQNLSPPPSPYNPDSPYIRLPFTAFHSSPHVPLPHPGFHSPPPPPPSLPIPQIRSPPPSPYNPDSPYIRLPFTAFHSSPPPSPSLYYSYNSPPQPSPSPFSPGIIPGVGPARHWRLSPPRPASASRLPSPVITAGARHWYLSRYLSPPQASSSLICPPFIPGVGVAKAWSPSPPASAAQGCPSESLSSRSTVPLRHQPPPPIKEVVGSLTKRQLETMRRRFEESKCRRVYVHGLDPSQFGQPYLFASFYQFGEIEQVMALYSHPSEKLSVSILYNSTSAAEECIIFEGRGHLATELCPDCPLF